MARDFTKRHWPTWLFGVAFGIFLYSMMMALQLTNTFDGLWDQNFRLAGASELSSGRWLLLYIDRLTMGLHADPITSIVALALFVLGFLLVLDLLNLRNRFIAFLSVALWVSSTVISNILSYRKTSFGYSVAFFLAALGIYAALKVKNKFAAIALSGLSLGLAMAGYQAFLGIFCLGALFYIISLYTADDSPVPPLSAVLPILLRVICSAVFGAVFYVATLFVVLKLNNTTISTYNGIGDITPLGLLKGLPRNLYEAYRTFVTYFLTDALKLNHLQRWGILHLFVVLLVALFLFLWIRAWKKNKRSLLVVVPAALVIPVACSAYMLIAGDKLELQMTGGLAILVPLTVALAFPHIEKWKPLRVIFAAFFVLLLYGNSLQVSFDQEAMYEGVNACETMATQVIADLNDEDLLSDQYEYYFIGVPARNDYFSVSDIFRRSNGYAQVGNFWVSGGCGQLSYWGLINNRMGIALPMAYPQYDEVAALCDVENLPTFPNDGYITVVDDELVIIKISEYAPYMEYSLYN